MKLEVRTVAFVGAGVAAACVAVCGVMKLLGSGKVNHKISKDEAKVVSKIDIEDLGDVTAFCRCWKSSKFPLCDGSHNKHNATTGDNIGPILMNRRTETS